ncbi:ITPRIPL2 isoform 2, partial [Pongo abelii]
VALRRRPGRGPTRLASSALGSRLRHFLPASWRGLTSPSEEETPGVRVTGSGAERSGGRARRAAQAMSSCAVATLSGSASCPGLPVWRVTPPSPRDTSESRASASCWRVTTSTRCACLRTCWATARRT